MILCFFAKRVFSPDRNWWRAVQSLAESRQPLPRPHCFLAQYSHRSLLAGRFSAFFFFSFFLLACFLSSFLIFSVSGDDASLDDESSESSLRDLPRVRRR